MGNAASSDVDPNLPNSDGNASSDSNLDPSNARQSLTSPNTTQDNSGSSTSNNLQSSIITNEALDGRPLTRARARAARAPESLSNSNSSGHLRSNSRRNRRLYGDSDTNNEPSSFSLPFNSTWRSSRNRNTNTYSQSGGSRPDLRSDTISSSVRSAMSRLADSISQEFLGSISASASPSSASSSNPSAPSTSSTSNSRPGLDTSGNPFHPFSEGSNSNSSNPDGGMTDSLSEVFGGIDAAAQEQLSNQIMTLLEPYLRPPVEASSAAADTPELTNPNTSSAPSRPSTNPPTSSQGSATTDFFQSTATSFFRILSLSLGQLSSPDAPLSTAENRRTLPVFIVGIRRPSEEQSSTPPANDIFGTVESIDQTAPNVAGTSSQPSPRRTSETYGVRTRASTRRLMASPINQPQTTQQLNLPAQVWSIYVIVAPPNPNSTQDSTAGNGNNNGGFGLSSGLSPYILASLLAGFGDGLTYDMLLSLFPSARRTVDLSVVDKVAPKFLFESQAFSDSSVQASALTVVTPENPAQKSSLNSLLPTAMALGQTHAQCSICLTQYDSNEYVRLLPCKHLFHSECVDRWLTKEKGCCPVCRRDIEVDESEKDMANADSSIPATRNLNHEDGNNSSIGGLDAQDMQTSNETSNSTSRASSVSADIMDVEDEEDAYGLVDLGFQPRTMDRGEAIDVIDWGRVRRMSSSSGDASDTRRRPESTLSVASSSNFTMTETSSSTMHSQSSSSSSTRTRNPTRGSTKRTRDVSPDTAPSASVSSQRRAKRVKIDHSSSLPSTSKSTNEALSTSTTRLTRRQAKLIANGSNSALNTIPEELSDSTVTIENGNIQRGRRKGKGRVRQ